MMAGVIPAFSWPGSEVWIAELDEVLSRVATFLGVVVFRW
jgi:hypothetical protein